MQNVKNTQNLFPARLNHLYETIDLDDPSVKSMIYQAIYKENSWTSLKPSRFLLLRLFDEICSNHFEFFALYNSSWSKSKGVYVLQKKRGFRHFLHNKHEKELMVLVQAGFISRKKNKLFLTQSGKEVLIKEKIARAVLHYGEKALARTDLTLMNWKTIKSFSLNPRKSQRTKRQDVKTIERKEGLLDFKVVNVLNSNKMKRDRKSLFCLFITLK